MQLTNPNKMIGEGKTSPLFDDRLLVAGLFIICLVVWGKNAFYGQAYGMLVIAISMLAIMAGDIFISLFGIYCACWFTYFLSSHYSGLIPASDIIQTMDTMFLIVGGLIIYVGVKYGKTSKETWFNAICIVTSIIVIIGLIQYYYNQPARATLGNQNFLGAFIAICAICFLRAKWWTWLLLPIILIGLYSTHCATAIIALIVGLCYLAWGWKGVAISTIPGLLYILLFKGFGSLINRAGYWTDAFDKLSNHWYLMLFGTGPGILWQYGNMLHSEISYLLWNFGIIGLILYIGYIIASCRRVSDRQLFAIFLVIIVDGISNHLMHVASTAYLALVFLALKDRPLEV